MGPLIAKAHTEITCNPAFKEFFDAGGQIRYSFDNASIHTAALKKGANGQSLLSVFGFDEDMHRLPLPPHSGDMHKIIEHTHGVATDKFRKWLNSNPGKFEVERYKEEFERIYQEEMKQHRVKADVETLRATYMWIVDNDGAYPPKRLR